jgi:glyoxylase I family protein
MDESPGPGRIGHPALGQDLAPRLGASHEHAQLAPARSAALASCRMAESARPRVPGINHLGLSVRDLDRSIAFYCDVLGAKVVRPPYEGDNESFAGRMALVTLGALGLDLFEHEANQDGGFDPAHTGLDHIALTAMTRDQLDRWASWLDGHGVAHSPLRETYGFGRMFDFRDPDGIQIEFYFLDYEKLNESGYVSGNRDD